jgi:hypothetical protein
LSVLLALSATAAMAGIVTTFSSTAKYRIESLYLMGSSAALGANHGVNSPLCMTTDNTNAADCYWYFVSQGSGRYALRNAGTNQYITLDDQYTNSPQILRYVHLSSSLEGDASLWYICNTTDSEGTELFYFQSASDESYFFNVRTGSLALGAYSKSGIPYGLNETFNLYDDKGKQFFTDGGGDDPIDPDPDVDSTQLQPVEGRILYIYLSDGRVEAIPAEYIETVNGQPLDAHSSLLTPHSSLLIKTKSAAHTYEHAAYEVDSLSEVAPEMPIFNSFKFNNKFNRHIIDDAQGVFDEDSLINLSVVGIGKTLRPSFQLDDDVQAFIGDSLQRSKRTRVRFDKDIIYTVARRGHTILRQRLNGEYVVMPYGREVKVQVDFATDHSTGAYRVPTIYLTTDDGNRITSKYTYKSGKVRIDGAGVFPDLAETPMQIKGRGNSSWTSSGKAPYHMKFETALKVLGLKKGKHWNLIANAQNLSMTCNAVAMKMAQLVETAGFNHEIPVELYLNGEYRGSYNLTEKVGLSNNSIDLADETYATLLELDSYYDETYKFRDQTFNLPVNIKDPDLSDPTTKVTQQFIEMGFNRATAALKNREDLRYSFDLDYLARFLFVDDYTANMELFHPKSTFLYNANILDTSSPFVFGPVWDFDWAFGYSSNYGYFTADATTNFWTSRPSSTGAQWAQAQRYCGEAFNQKYYQLWYDFLTDGSLQELIDFCDDYYQFAAPSLTHDNTMWRRGDASTYATVTANAKTWLQTRANYIFNYLSNTLGYAGKDYLDTTGGILPGDVNDDGQVTTSDVVCVLNYMLNLPNDEFEYGQADIDGNDIITVGDLIGVRNLVATSTTKSGRYYSLPEAEAVIQLGGDPSNSPKGEDTGAGSKSSPFRGIRGDLPLTLNVSGGDYSGVQFDISLPEGMTLDDVDVSRSLPDFDVSIAEVENPDQPQTSNLQPPTYRVSIYSSARSKLPLGSSVLTLELGCDGEELGVNYQLSTINSQPSTVTLRDVHFATSLGEDHRSRATTIQLQPDTPTGIDNSEQRTENNGQSVYDLQGRKVNGQSSMVNGQLPKGIYIIRGRKVVK